MPLYFWTSIHLSRRQERSGLQKKEREGQDLANTFFQVFVKKNILQRWCSKLWIMYLIYKSRILKNTSVNNSHYNGIAQEYSNSNYNILVITNIILFNYSYKEEMKVKLRDSEKYTLGDFI